MFQSLFIQLRKIHKGNRRLNQELFCLLDLGAVHEAPPPPVPLLEDTAREQHVAVQVSRRPEVVKEVIAFKVHALC
jgi:hypothetical protein